MEIVKLKADCSEWSSGFDGGLQRVERAACRRHAIMVSPTQAVPEVPVVWGYDEKRGIVCRRYTIMVAKIPPQKTHQKSPQKSHQKSRKNHASKKRDGNDPTIIA